MTCPSCLPATGRRVSRSAPAGAMRARQPREDTRPMTEALWTPSAERLACARLGRFMAEVRDRWGVEVADYGALHAWSVAEPAQFWRSLWDFCGIVGDGPGARIAIDGDRMPGARWFPTQAQLRREPAAPARRGGRAGFLGRGPGAAAPQLRRPARPGLAHGPGAQQSRRPPGGPGRGLPAQHAGDRRRRAGDGEPRRRLVLVFVGFRHARRARPLRPDRTRRC